MRLGNLRWTLTGFLFLTQCADLAEDPKLVALRAANQACKDRLAQADYLGASDGAKKHLADVTMLAANRDLAEQLRFCQAYARTLYALDQSSTFIQKFTVAMSDLFKARPAQAPYRAQAAALESTILDNVVTVILEPLTSELETVDRTFAQVAEHSNFTWRIERLPVNIAGKELFDAGGLYDTGEVEIVRGLVGMVLGSLYTLQSLDYRVNIGAVVEYARLTDSPLKTYKDHPVAGIFNAAAVLLGTAPSFLALKPGDGKEWMAKAGAGYTSAVGSLLRASDFIKNREGAQDAHIVEYQRADDQDYFVLHLTFKKTLSPDFKIDLSKFNDTSIPLRDDVSRSMTRVRDSLQAGGGKRASVQDDLFPIMALVGVVALKSGALDASIDKALEEVDPELAAQLKATVDYGEISQEHFLSLLLTAVPVKMEIDMGRSFAQPAPLRDMLPAWFQPDANGDGSFAMSAFTEATFVVEYECAANPLFGASKKIFCEGPADQTHFQDLGAVFPWKNQTASDNFGPKWEGQIEKDLITSRGPYIGFKDPTFNSTLFMDYTTLNVAPPSSETFAPANQAAVNAMLNTLTEAVLTVYQ